MPLSSFALAILCPFALAGLGSIALGAMLATPLRRPAPLASVHAGALHIDTAGKPDLTRFQARDGTWLAFRLYRPIGESVGRVAILAHGSSASSDEMHVVARELAANGVAAVAVDMRGHGASGARGDIAYVGQLDDDLVDLVAHLRRDFPSERFELLGHSSGGGFAIRIAGSPAGSLFDRFILLAPFLGARAPSTRPTDGAGRWAEVDLPRIVAILILRRFGVTLGQSLPVIAFANAPESAMFVTSTYSYRLLADYGPDFLYSRVESDFRSASGRVRVIAGEDDELMDASAYAPALTPLGAVVTLVPGVDHMGIVYRQQALAAIVAAAK